MKNLLFALLGLLAVSCGNAQSNKSGEPAARATQPKVLVAYFSCTGTTKAKAQAIADKLGCDIMAITPAEAYTEADLDWRDEASRSTIEMKDETARPALAASDTAVADYDVVLLGFPIWWDTCPRAVNSFLESQDFKGKTVIPFATSGGSTIDNSVKNLKAQYPDIDWQNGQLLNGSDAEAAEWAMTAVKETAE